MYTYNRDLSVCRLCDSCFLSGHEALAMSETNACTIIIMYNLHVLACACRSVDLCLRERMYIYNACMWDIRCYGCVQTALKVCVCTIRDTCCHACPRVQLFTPRNAAAMQVLQRLHDFYVNTCRPRHPNGVSFRNICSVRQVAVSLPEFSL